MDYMVCMDRVAYSGKVLENLLGFALMEVRDEIRRTWKNADMCEKVRKHF